MVYVDVQELTPHSYFSRTAGNRFSRRLLDLQMVATSAFESWRDSNDIA